MLSIFLCCFFWVHIIFSLLRGGSVSSTSSSLTLDNMRCIGYTRGTLNTEVKLWLRLSRSNSQAPAETAVPVSQSANSHAGTGEAVSTASAATPSLARPTNWVSAGTLVAVSPSAPTASARMRLAADAVAPTPGKPSVPTRKHRHTTVFFLYSSTAFPYRHNLDGLLDCRQAKGQLLYGLGWGCEGCCWLFAGFL